jgi:PAS domain S-box-containing protein
MDKTTYSILAIDDDEVDRMAMARMMKKHSDAFHCDLAESIAQAREMIPSGGYDVIVSDYNLTDGKAFDVFEFSGEIPVIVVTGAGNEEVAVEALRVGAYDYIVKDHARHYLEVMPMLLDKAINHRNTEKQLREYHEGLEVLVAERTAELAKEKELLGTTLASMSDGIIVVDTDAKVMLLNTVAEQLTGWTQQDASGKPVDEVLVLVDDKTAKTTANPLIQSLQSADICSGSDWDAALSPCGTQHPVFVTAAPIKNPDSTIAGAVAVLRDVTKERKVEHMKSSFVSSVSHELRTPLTSIKAFTSTIIRDPNMPDETRNEFLKIIDEESDRLANLIEDLLQISRIEDDSVELKRQAVSLNKEVERTITAMKPLAEKKNIQLIADVPDDAPQISADESKMKSVLTNLINNAIKFTPDGGSVTTSLRYDNDTVTLCVRDTGMGIPDSDLEKIFRRFHRVHRPGTEIQGTGLGLAIVKKIIEMHQGTITVESTVGEGTSFTVTIPLHLAAEQNDQREPAVSVSAS